MKIFSSIFVPHLKKVTLTSFMLFRGAKIGTLLCLNDENLHRHNDSNQMNISAFFLFLFYFACANIVGNFANLNLI